MLNGSANEGRDFIETPNCIKEESQLLSQRHTTANLLQQTATYSMLLRAETAVWLCHAARC